MEKTILDLALGSYFLCWSNGSYSFAFRSHSFSHRWARQLVSNCKDVPCDTWSLMIPSEMRNCAICRALYRDLLCCRWSAYDRFVSCNRTSPARDSEFKDIDTHIIVWDDEQIRLSYTLKNCRVLPPRFAPNVNGHGLLDLAHSRSVPTSLMTMCGSAMVRQAAKLAVYDDTMINVKNHHTDEAIRMDAAFGSISEPYKDRLWLVRPSFISRGERTCCSNAPAANHIELCNVNWFSRKSGLSMHGYGFSHCDGDILPRKKKHNVTNTYDTAR